jgi:hypothetical protein
MWNRKSLLSDLNCACCRLKCVFRQQSNIRIDMWNGWNSPTFRGPFLTPSSGLWYKFFQNIPPVYLLVLMFELITSEWGLLSWVKCLLCLAYLWIGASAYFLIMLVTVCQNRLKVNLGPCWSCLGEACSRWLLFNSRSIYPMPLSRMDVIEINVMPSFKSVFRDSILLELV